MMLETWDFKEPLINSTTPQINRQKSARNLMVIAIDKHNATAVFFDVKKGTKNNATLKKCDCKDFNFSGNAPRKIFKPCMHIYRLAMELGLLETKYEDHRAKEARIFQQNQADTVRLQALNRDPSLWGGWDRLVHEAGIQKNRQYRGYLILNNEADEVRKVKNGWVIHEYYVTLEACECADFITRILPCKHIYAAALASGIALPLTPGQFVAAKNQGLENVFRYEDL
jgi:predicted nucleic acid-binding Zn finger protein